MSVMADVRQLRRVLVAFAFLFSAVVVTGYSTVQQPTIPDYDRSEWRHWIDVDGDCLNTRQEVLERDAVELGASNRNGCRWLTGEWVDPYTGRTVTSAGQLQIDHIVSLVDAHHSGGWQWDADQKRDFANDMSNLLAVWGPENQSKSGRGPSEWEPPADEFICEYAKRYATVKRQYGLMVTMDDAHALAQLWASCPPWVD